MLITVWTEIERKICSALTLAPLLVDAIDR